MQKAHCHPIKRLQSLVSAWFQSLFTPLLRVLFTFPLRYWFAIGLSVVFRLTRWCWWIQAGFLQSRPTQDTARYIYNVEYGAITLYGSYFHEHSSIIYKSTAQSYNPGMLAYRFGLFRFRSPLLTESLLFSFPPPT
jgi:hypothetical protein